MFIQLSHGHAPTPTLIYRTGSLLLHSSTYWIILLHAHTSSHPSRFEAWKFTSWCQYEHQGCIFWPGYADRESGREEKDHMWNAQLYCPWGLFRHCKWPQFWSRHLVVCCLRFSSKRTIMPLFHQGLGKTYRYHLLFVHQQPRYLRAPVLQMIWRVKTGSMLELYVRRKRMCWLPQVCHCLFVNEECHKLHSAISPPILRRFPRSQSEHKALKKTFRSIPVTSRSDQYWPRY